MSRSNLPSSGRRGRLAPFANGRLRGSLTCPGRLRGGLTHVALTLPVLLAVFTGGGGLASADEPGAKEQSSTLLELARQREQQVIDLIARTSRAFVAIGGGSGIIISPDGEILTNDHVAGSKEIGESWVVVLPGSRFATATMIATDPRGDIALLKLDRPGPYPYVELADSDQVRAGDSVLALGNPFGFSKDGTPHASIGVISAVHRYQGGYSDAIQTDTAINPGNSGGPLLDMAGRLVGINGRIAVRFGTRANTGVGYAIPTNQIRAFLPMLRAGGVVNHGVVRGVSLGDTPSGGVGAVIKRVVPGSDAHRAGLRQGDRIIGADGRVVHNPRRFQGIVGSLPAGSEIVLLVQRGEEVRRLNVNLEPRDQGVAVGNAKGGFLGVRFLPADADDGEDGEEKEAREGVEVEEVVAGSPADAAGLKAGDRIRSIDGKPTPNAATLVRQLSEHAPGTTIRLSVLRGDQTLDLQATLGERPGQSGR